MRIGLFPVLFLSLTLASAADPKHPAWTPEDSVSAVGFVKTITTHPEAIDSLIAGALMRDHELGFGHHMREAWINPAGKLGFSAKIVYAGKQPISFEIKPVLNYGGLKARYLQLLTPTFRVRPIGGANLALAPYYWNLDAVAKPLPVDSLGGALNDSLPSADVRDALAFYMTPYSGTLYGIRGGDARQLLENRDHFLDLNDMLMADKRLSRYLLRSLNPASRLTAAEFIIRHRDDFPDYEALLKKPIRLIFANPPKAATLRGNTEATEDARKLTFEYSALEVLRDGRGILRMY